MAKINYDSVADKYNASMFAQSPMSGTIIPLRRPISIIGSIIGLIYVRVFPTHTHLIITPRNMNWQIL